MKEKPQGHRDQPSSRSIVHVVVAIASKRDTERSPYEVQ
jgi:hypothetical protein